MPEDVDQVEKSANHLKIDKEESLVELIEKSMDNLKIKRSTRVHDLDHSLEDHSVHESGDIIVGEIDEGIELKMPSDPSETVIEPKAYLKMVLHAGKYAGTHLPKTKWVEVIGILTGFIEHKDTPLERIVVKDAFPIGHGDAISVVIQNPQSMERVYRTKNSSHFIIGWYHSHPSYGCFMSNEDYQTQLRYQTLWSESIAIVIDPAQVSKANYGFEIFRLKRPKLKSWEVLPYRVHNLSPAPLPQLVEFLQPLIGGDALFLEYE